MPLVPNGPRDRIRYVIQTYRNTKTRFIIPETIEAAMFLLGLDGQASDWNDRYSALWHYLFSGEKRHIAHDKGMIELFRGESIESYVDWLFDQMPDSVAALPHHHPLDFVIPWMAKELNRLGKAVLSGSVERRDFEDAVTALKQKGPAIGMWARANGVDLMKTDLSTALEAIKDFEVETRGMMPQGVVVHAWDDGWTVQELRDGEALDSEGAAMQHCVDSGSYLNEIKAGRARIYSLRDPSGKPHATMEWEPRRMSPAWLLADTTGTAREVWSSPELFAASELRLFGQFVQIQGKQNEPVAEKYRLRVQEFIKTVFGGEPLGMLMVAMPGQEISFRGHRIEDINFGDEVFWGDGRANFAGAELVRAEFAEAYGLSFDEAILEQCRLAGEITNCSFLRCKMREVQFALSAVGMVGCRFTSSRMDSVDIFPEIFRNSAAPVTSCAFDGVRWENPTWNGLVFTQCDFRRSEVYRGEIDDVTFQGCEVGGFAVDVAPERLNGIKLYDLDLSQTPVATVEALLRATVDADDDIALPPGM